MGPPLSHHKVGDLLYTLVVCYSCYNLCNYPDGAPLSYCHPLHSRSIYLKTTTVPVSQILVKRGMNLYSLDPEEARAHMTKKIEEPDMTDPVPLKCIRYGDDD